VDELLGVVGDRLVTVLFLDLDGFKLVNDSLGHAVGDELLHAVADRLRSSVRPSDAIARVGGDEFAIAASIGSLDESTAMARRLLAGLRAPIGVGDTEILVRASIGVCTSDLAPDREALLRDADVAMYEAKAAGKDRFEVFRPEFHARVVERLDLEHDLRLALERQEFVVFFQPVVDLRTGAVSGHEALVRWQHPARGLLLPGAFISVTEETGLIVPLGHFVLRTAIATLATWRDAGWTGWMSINLAPRQLLEPSLENDVRALIERYDVPAPRIRLEITESAGLSHDDRAREVVTALARLGVGIALDDFGTGYSSLERAAELPITVLKVDRSFVAGMGHDRVRTAVAEAAIAFGHALGVVIVAEGIETVEQRDLLAELGCEYGQGYLFGRPEQERGGPPGVMATPIRHVRPSESVA
jgi:diguanylate cyclase (GGDEF)-like protein